MKSLNKGSNVGITVCSNAYSYDHKAKLAKLSECLQELELQPVYSKCIYSADSFLSGTGKERARELMNFFEDDSIEAIFDISGGNVANDIIPYLDYESIRRHAKPMFGYSDLTSVLNAIYTKTGVTTYLYQIRNLMYSCGEMQKKWVQESLCEGKNTLFDFPVTWIQGHSMEGIAVGGNIRCLLKLAGTPYFPETNGRILVLESYGGKPDLIASQLTQLKMMGVLEQLAGILLGTFTTMEENQYQPTVEKLVVQILDKPECPIAKTSWIGHGMDSKGIRIGEKMSISEKHCLQYE